MAGRSKFTVYVDNDYDNTRGFDLTGIIDDIEARL